PATTYLDPPSLHDALPISRTVGPPPYHRSEGSIAGPAQAESCSGVRTLAQPSGGPAAFNLLVGPRPLEEARTPSSVRRSDRGPRSEEHTSELQSPDQLVCR